MKRGGYGLFLTSGSLLQVRVSESPHASPRPVACFKEGDEKKNTRCYTNLVLGAEDGFIFK